MPSHPPKSRLFSSQVKSALERGGIKHRAQASYVAEIFEMTAANTRKKLAGETTWTEAELIAVFAKLDLDVLGLCVRPRGALPPATDSEPAPDATPTAESDHPWVRFLRDGRP